MAQEFKVLEIVIDQDLTVKIFLIRVTQVKFNRTIQI